MRHSRLKPCLWLLFAAALFTLPIGCGDSELPLTRLQRQLQQFPTYSIILENMKQEGNFFDSYYHRYRVVQPNKGSYLTDWMEVPKSYYRKYMSFLGMALAGKKDNQPMQAISPPGFMYVGDPDYGYWRQGPDGNMMWEFDLDLDDALGGWTRHRIHKNEYEKYRRAYAKKTPYLGKSKKGKVKYKYGTQGNLSKKAKPDFFVRRKAKKTSSFASKVSSRIGRTKTTYRSRSGGFGK